jgi:ABC-2 type transport system permease protein
VNLREQGLQHAVLVDAYAMRRPGGLNVVIQFIDKTLVIAELEARKLLHDPTEVIMRAIQPALGSWCLARCSLGRTPFQPEVSPT